MILQSKKYLENVGTLKSVISQTRWIDKGESVGYGRKFIADKPTEWLRSNRYADGISRSWGNGLLVYIKDQHAKILEVFVWICSMVDVTEIDCTVESQLLFLVRPTVSISLKN
jgi:alanine racemase